MPQYQDAFDLYAALIVKAPEDIASWPADVGITQVSFGSAPSQGLHFETTPKPWPTDWRINAGWDGPIQYTVWLFVPVGRRWVGSGFIQMWNTKDWTGAPLLQYYRDWVIGDRWSPMDQYSPAPGATIGLMLSCGNARGGGVDPLNTPMRSRSNAVLVTLMDSGLQSFTPVEASTPSEPPHPLPPSPGAPTPPEGGGSVPLSNVQMLAERLQSLYNAYTQDNQRLIDLAADVERLKARLPADGSETAGWRGQLKLPYVSAGISFVADTPVTAAAMAYFKKNGRWPPS